MERSRKKFYFVLQSSFLILNKILMNEHLEHLKEIRTLMERSSKFLSLSGLSGISAGFCALIGAWFAYQKLYEDTTLNLFDPLLRRELLFFLLIDATLVLFSALLLGIFFTIRRAKSQNLSIWNPSTKRLLLSMALPLLVGGIFCIGLINSGYFWLCFPSTLIFYGIALVNAAQYTVNDTYYLGVAEIGLGLTALFFAKWNLLFWAIGFGLFHIIYGVIMYFQYERKKISAFQSN